MDAVYVSYEVTPEGLKDKLRELISSGVSGINVTIPHKEKIIGLLDEVTPEAAAIGAVNTVLFKGGKSMGYNTDAKGFLLSLKKDLKADPKNKSVLILGAGGAAKAIAYILAKGGTRSILFNDIIPDRARGLADKIKNEFPDCKTDCVESTVSEMEKVVRDVDILINATPVGMAGKEDNPLPVLPALHKDLSVYDIVYNPPETLLLREAKKRGAKGANGLGMLLYQGALSFELFTGKKAPVSVMRAALKKAIK